MKSRATAGDHTTSASAAARGKGEILDIFWRPQEFAPKVALGAEDVPLFFRRQLGRQRLEGIHGRQGNESPDALGFSRSLGLRVIEVAVRGGRHDHVVPGRRRRDAARGAAPRHHRRAGRETAFENFIPADQPPAFADEEFLDLIEEVSERLVEHGEVFAVGEEFADGLRG